MTTYTTVAFSGAAATYYQVSGNWLPSQMIDGLIILTRDHSLDRNVLGMVDPKDDEWPMSALLVRLGDAFPHRRADTFGR